MAAPYIPAKLGESLGESYDTPITRSPAQKPAHKGLGRNGQKRAITTKAAYAPVSKRAGSRFPKKKTVSGLFHINDAFRGYVLLCRGVRVGSRVLPDELGRDGLLRSFRPVVSVTGRFVPRRHR